MSEGKLEALDFDEYLSLSERAHREEVVRSNDAFVLAMARAVRKGRENAVPGTFVDTTPPISAVRIHPAAFVSCCDSPAQMCMEIGGAPGGTESMKA